MSKTAKQDTAKEQAEAAATPASEARAAATEDKSETAAPEETAEAAEAPEASDLDETKRKFREALERKHQVHNDGQGKGGREGSKINGAHGPAAGHRNFRRKSG